MTEAQMKKRHGWTPESKMAARYVHLVNADVDTAIFEHLGIDTKKKEEKNLLPKICKICEIPNSSDSKICSKCGKPLDLAASIELDEKNQQQIIEQNKKIEDLEESLKSFQNDMKRRDKEWERSMIKSIMKVRGKIRYNSEMSVL